MILDREKIEKIETRESRTLEGVHTETHLTRWRGTLTDAQIQAILEAYLAEQLGQRRFGLSSHFSEFKFLADQDGYYRFCDLSFEIVHDHDWYIKETAAEAAEG